MGRKYTDEQIRFIADSIKGRSHAEMADMFNAHFGTNISAPKIMSLSMRNGLKNGIVRRLEKGATVGIATQFKKGLVPWNKGGKKTYAGGEETQFKKGNRPQNYKPVGTELVNTDGYVVVKIADPNKWRQKHRLIWEASNGPIPKGHCLIFADSNPLNVTLDNLILITRAQLAVMNKRGLVAQSRDLTETGIIIADIVMKATQRKRK
jgi:hypothetical protein